MDNDVGQDSESTLCSTQQQDTINEQFRPSKSLFLDDCQLNSIMEEFEETRKSTKSKKKKAKRLREKCRAIQKEISVGEEDILEARQAWETTKQCGLATKGDDEEVVQIIARNINIALEKVERQKRS